MFGNVVYVNNYIVSKSMNITPFWSLLGTENDVIDIFYSGEALNMVIFIIAAHSRAAMMQLSSQNLKAQ